MDYNREVTEEDRKNFTCRLKKNNIERDLNNLGIRTKEEFDLSTGTNIDVGNKFNSWLESLSGGKNKKNIIKSKKYKSKSIKKYKSKSIKRSNR